MIKPQVNINLNIEVNLGDLTPSDHIKCQLDDAMTRATLLVEQVNSTYHQDTDTTVHLKPDNKPPATSRHWQAVTINNRISDAIEFVNKEIKLQRGNGDNACLKVLEELKIILLGMN